MKNRWNRGVRVLGVSACLALVLAACGDGSIDKATDENKEAQAECGGDGELNLAVNPWVGMAADAYVVGTLADQELGCKVNYKELKEDVAWQEFKGGGVDVVIEDWGHPALEDQYFAEKGDGSAEDFGPTGNIGIIGWYVPPWLAEEHPDILEYENLNKYADKFKTSESGGKGQFLGADPSYKQFDEAIIANLDLDFKVVFSGGEAASISAFKKAEKNKEWMIGYFYDPQWLLAEIPVKKVALPEYTDGCQDDPAKVACDYPETELKKIVSTSWSGDGGAMVDLVKSFSWTNEDQNLVAKYIADDKMTPEDAAKKWIADNPDKVDAWLGR
ncbi:ABC transporter substrate-binding protein [Nocardioides jensenii]|uniref:ABC transporter substrate-binding protein n=1 Tax=Nocardioides jensenii TaxID=1843 RepID=UPI00082A9989|nr:ABC transporter substrate-binding protein [Nocardioides jensenii]